MNVPNNVRRAYMNKLGVRRSLRSLHEFSFAHQRVRILLRKNKKTRTVGLSAIPLSLQPPHFVAVAAFGVATIPNAEMRKKLKNPLSELALQTKGICFMFRLASVCNQIGSRELI